MFTLPSIMQSAVQTALPTPLQNALPTMWPTAWATTLPMAWPGNIATAFSTVWPAPAALPAGVSAGVAAVLPAELLNVTRNFAELQLASCTALMQAAFNGSASLFDVNVHATRDGLEAANAASNQLMFVREPRDLVCLTASQSQQAMERAQRYGRQVAGVANETHTRLGELSRDFAGSLPRNPIE